MHPISKPGHWQTWPQALRGMCDYIVMGAILWTVIGIGIWTWSTFK